MAIAPRMGIPAGEFPSGIGGPQRRQPVFDGSGTPIYRLPPNELHAGSEDRTSLMAVDWGVTALNCDAAHKVTRGEGVKVCIADTGTDPLHPDLREAFEKDSDHKSFVRGESYNDGNGHGTHCGGRAFGRGTENGVAPGASGMTAKVLSNRGSGGVDGIADGIRWAVDNGAGVISMSLGSNAEDSWIPPALEYAEKNGVIVVAAAGNDGPNEGTQDYPGSYPQCVCVGALDVGMSIARFSSRGPALFVAAPGVNIRSQYPGGRYATMSGTSMATPHVAGLAALWLSVNKSLPKDATRPAKFRQALKDACKDLGVPGRDTAYGWGFPDAAKLVAGGQVPPPPPPPPPGGSLLFPVETAAAVKVLRDAGYTVTKAAESDLVAVVSNKLVSPPSAMGRDELISLIVRIILEYLKNKA